MNSISTSEVESKYIGHGFEMDYHTLCAYSTKHARLRTSGLQEIRQHGHVNEIDR